MESARDMQSAKEYRRAEEIRRQYAPESPEQTKFGRLKALDAKVRRPARIFAYSFGGAGTLVLGTGMCMAMGAIGGSMALGIVIGVAGIAMVCANYFLYKAILKNRKKKYAEQIMTLSDGLLGK